MTFLHVERVEHIRGFELRLAFSDGSVRDVNLSGELDGEVFEPLRDPEIFREARLNPETKTVEWPNGADFAPEFLHEVGSPVVQEA